MKTHGIFVLVFLYLLLPLVQSAVYIDSFLANGGPFGASLDPFQALNFVSSIFSYHWLLANVLLSLKLPFLQNGLPYDLRIRYHIWSTMGVALLLLWHAVYTIFLNPQTIDLFSWIPLPVFVILLVASMLWIPLPLVRKLVLTKAYDFLKSGHKVLFLVLAAFTWWHVADRGMSILDPNNSHNAPPASAWGYQILFAVTVLAYLVARTREAFLPVVEVKAVTHLGGIARLTLTNHPRLKYHAGQFAFLRFLTPGLRGEEHPFSFTSTADEGTIGFAIRELGDFTRKLAGLKPGDKVRVNAGFGSFNPIRRGRLDLPLALIGSGIGVAPLIGILKELAEKDPTREVVYLQAVTVREELLEPERVAEIARVMPNLKVKTYIYKEDFQLYDANLFAQELVYPRKFQVFLCSSERVRERVVPALKSLGIPSKHIIFEAFSF